MRSKFEWLASIARAQAPPADLAACYQDLKRAAPELMLYIATLEEAVRPLAELEARKVALSDREAVAMQRAVNFARAIFANGTTLRPPQRRRPAPGIPPALA